MSPNTVGTKRRRADRGPQLAHRVTKSSPNQGATGCYAFDSDGSPPPIAGSPHNGTLEAPLPPCGASSFSRQLAASRGPPACGEAVFMSAV